ncbi:MAG: hypothetical protein OJF55_001310 [Rhodanobacteraceae bacterium]|jgi:hypothetical protein|nr:MAG: hypothetical protein OJF55_001310 [Rhodanobacteraceae bacterium]
MGNSHKLLLATTLVLSVACAAFTAAPVSHAADIGSTPVKANDAAFEQCRAKLKAAAALGLLTNMSYDGGRPRVEVGPDWYKINFSAKEGLARTAACFFLAGDTSSAIRFEITDSMTGKVIATWAYTKLVVK